MSVETAPKIDVPAQRGPLRSRAKERLVSYTEISSAILKKAKSFVGREGYVISTLDSTCGKIRALVIENEADGNSLVAAIIKEDGKEQRATLFGHLDGDQVEVSTICRYGILLPVYRQERIIGNLTPWNIIDPMKQNPFLQAVGLR